MNKSDYRDLTLKYLREHPGADWLAICGYVGGSRRTFAKVFVELQKAGLVVLKRKGWDVAPTVCWECWSTLIPCSECGRRCCALCTPFCEDHKAAPKVRRAK